MLNSTTIHHHRLMSSLPENYFLLPVLLGSLPTLSERVHTNGDAVKRVSLENFQKKIETKQEKMWRTKKKSLNEKEIEVQVKCIIAIYVEV